MPYVEVPIIGTGTERDPYRPSLPAGVTRWSAHIPSNPDGRPRFLTALVWIPPNQPMTGLSPIDRNTALDIARTRDNRIDDSSLEHIERI